MSNWKTYRIGNGLRGHHIYKARSVKEAWKVGCRLFNEAFGPEGRIVYLSEKRVETQPLLTTQWVRDQLALPKKGTLLLQLRARDGRILAHSGLWQEHRATADLTFYKRLSHSSAT